MEKEADEFLKRMSDLVTASGADPDVSLTVAGTLMSIAISLKRLADEFCYKDVGLNLNDHIRSIAEAAQSMENRR